MSKTARGIAAIFIVLTIIVVIYFLYRKFFKNSEGENDASTDRGLFNINLGGVKKDGDSAPETTPPPPSKPVIGGIQAKVGDKLVAAKYDAAIFKTADSATKLSGVVIPVGNYVGQVIDASNPKFLKVQLFHGPPVWNGKSQTVFYVTKYGFYTYL